MACALCVVPSKASAVHVQQLRWGQTSNGRGTVALSAALSRQAAKWRRNSPADGG